MCRELCFDGRFNAGLSLRVEFRNVVANNEGMIDDFMAHTHAARCDTNFVFFFSRVCAMSSRKASSSISIARRTRSSVLAATDIRSRFARRTSARFKVFGTSRLMRVFVTGIQEKCNAPIIRGQNYFYTFTPIFCRTMRILNSARSLARLAPSSRMRLSPASSAMRSESLAWIGARYSTTASARSFLNSP